MNAKTLLAVLLCHVLLSAQTYAIQGGPGGGGGGLALNVVGTYSGVLTGVQEKDPNTGITSASNSIALFSMNVPQTGNATGTSLVFSAGRVFSGTLTAVVDPESGSVRGIINATYNFGIAVPDVDANGNPITRSVTITASALGRIDAAIKASNNLSFFTGSTTPGTIVTARLTGTAQLNTDYGAIDASNFAPIIARTTRYVIDGFKQQATSSALQ